MKFRTRLVAALIGLASIGASEDPFPAQVLAQHNAERVRLGLAPLVWSERLTGDARVWAQSLARRRVFEHSRSSSQGENLWMGTAGFFSPEQMIGAFLGEARHFRDGVFPRVSRTGNWADVGHYSQIIWPTTRELGCAMARGGNNDVLVCRYWPAGNVMGQRVP